MLVRSQRVKKRSIVFLVKLLNKIKFLLSNTLCLLYRYFSLPHKRGYSAPPCLCVSLNYFHLVQGEYKFYFCLENYTSRVEANPAHYSSRRIVIHTLDWSESESLFPCSITHFLEQNHGAYAPSPSSASPSNFSRSFVAFEPSLCRISNNKNISQFPLPIFFFSASRPERWNFSFGLSLLFPFG